MRRAVAWCGVSLVCFGGSACGSSASSTPNAVEYTEQVAPLPATPPAALAANLASNEALASSATGAGPAQAPAGGGTGVGQPAAAAPGAAMTAGTGAPAPTSGAGGSQAAMGTGGASVMMGTGGMGAPPAGGTVTSLTATITTTTQGGKYAPKNVGAIWVADASGKWLYTLEYWNSLVNSQWLTKYNGVSGPAYVLFGATAPPDVIAGATLNAHKTHNVKWSLKNNSGAVVPDGAYKLVIELSEASATGKTQEYDFTKGAPATVMPPDTTYYTGVKIDLK